MIESEYNNILHINCNLIMSCLSIVLLPVYLQMTDNYKIQHDTDKEVSLKRDIFPSRLSV